MDKQSSSIQAPWIPQTPIKPVSPIYLDEQSNQNQTAERRFVKNKEMMSDLDHLSFGDLLALANTASSVYFSGQSHWANNVSAESTSKRGNTEMMSKGNESVESNNNVAEEIIKTPEKPKRRKHRPKVVREAKPKREPKPKPKPVAVDGQESKTPRRKYVRKKVEVSSKDQESATPVEDAAESASLETSTQAKKPCRRALDFEDESLKPEKGENQSNSSDTKQVDKSKTESSDCLPSIPSTPPKRKRNQSKRKEKEPNTNGSSSSQEGVDLLMEQAVKRRQGKEPTCDLNLSGFQYNEVCDIQKMHWLYVRNLQQGGMMSDAISFAGQRFDAQVYGSAFHSKCYSFASQFNANRVLTTDEQGKGFFQGTQSCLDKIDTPKKRTTGHARIRNVASINKLMEVPEQLPIGCYSTPQNKRVTVSKKKQTIKSNKSQTNYKTLLPKPRLPSPFTGSSPDELWEHLLSIETISEQLRLLDINKEYSETALVPYTTNSRGNKMIVFSSGVGAIVPSTPVKKRAARPRVDLDNETDRVWKLLMENINSDGINGSDEEKAKWWEEERNVFRGRADSFIARMHLVQGDRRFTPWKGSVVDSVVGVFLTQNVSDHLSSSAFMSLAAEYPAPLVSSRNFDVGTSSSMPSIRITYLDVEESVSNPHIHKQSSVSNEEKNLVNSDETSRSSSEIASSAHEPGGKTTDLKAHVDSDGKGISVEVDKTDQTYLVQELFPSEESALTYQNSLVSSDAPQNTERAGSSSEINSEGEYCTSFVKLLQGLGGSVQLQGKADTVSAEDCDQNNRYDSSSNLGSLQVSPTTSPSDSGVKSLKEPLKSSDDSNEPSPEIPESSSCVPSTNNKEELVTETLIPDINESTRYLDVQEGTEKASDSSSKDLNHMDDATTFDPLGKKVLKDQSKGFDWDSLRREAQGREGKREKTSRTMDSVDWEAIRTANVSEVADTIKSRGMNHKLAERIQGFLNRLVKEHGSIDLEWLRDVPPDKAKEFLLSFRGLGLKSVECVRLLTLHHLAFPVDTNVGRIAVRLGWVPLQPLPESLQLHLLEMYPVLESIQKYLWPRLCKLDQKTLYELHYQMITFGKVFCTKSKPNCNACPMRGECRHFASAFASARLALPGTEKGNETPNKNHPLPLHLPEPLQREQGGLEVVKRAEQENKVACCEPIIEEPASPEPECAPVAISDIEDAFFEEDPEEIPTIKLNIDAFTSNLKKIMEHNKELQEGNMSTALVALTAEAASLPMPKLKNINQLRTEHQVYELPDSHPLLVEMEKREPDDPCSYLLAIWTPGETVDSIQPAVSKCISQYTGKLCDEETCFSCNNVREARSQTVRGTILIPCRTAMRGSFPLNGTYFQVNEVFADHASSLNPIDVPRQWLWDLPRRIVYFGTSIPSIFKGLPTETIQQCFWRGYVCVRGFERKTRAPRPLIARLHFPASHKGKKTQFAK